MNIPQTFEQIISLHLKIKKLLQEATNTRDFEPAEAADDCLQQSQKLLQSTIKQMNVTNLINLHLPTQQELVTAQQMFIQQQTSIIDSILHVKQFQALSASENVASDLYTDVEEVQGLKNVIQSNLTQGKETVDNMNNELARQNGQIEDLQGRAKGVGSIFTKGGGLALKVAATENKHCLIQTAMIIVVIVSFIIIFVIKFTK